MNIGLVASNNRREWMDCIIQNKKAPG